MAHPPTHDALALAAAEAAAMQAITDILAGLPSDEARARVLIWCQEHFPATTTSPRPPRDNNRPGPPSARVVDDPGLTVDADIFDDLPLREDLIHCEALRLDGVEFEQVELDGLEVDVEPERPSIKPQRPASNGVGLESLLRDFVCDLQRLALECQVA